MQQTVAKTINITWSNRNWTQDSVGFTSNWLQTMAKTDFYVHTTKTQRWQHNDADDIHDESYGRREGRREKLRALDIGVRKGYAGYATAYPKHRAFFPKLHKINKNYDIFGLMYIMWFCITLWFLLYFYIQSQTV
jgi:hypothetical protein